MKLDHKLPDGSHTSQPGFPSTFSRGGGIGVSGGGVGSWVMPAASLPMLSGQCSGRGGRGSFLPLMDLRNDQPLQFPKTQALMIAVPGTLGAQLQTPHHGASPVRSTFLLRGHDSSAPGLHALRPLGVSTQPSPLPCVQSLEVGLPGAPRWGAPRSGGGGGQWSLGRLGFAPSWGAVERQMWAGARPAVAEMERVILTVAFFLELF